MKKPAPATGQGASSLLYRHFRPSFDSKGAMRGVPEEGVGRHHGSAEGKAFPYPRPWLRQSDWTFRARSLKLIEWSETNLDSCHLSIRPELQSAPRFGWSFRSFPISRQTPSSSPWRSKLLWPTAYWPRIKKDWSALVSNHRFALHETG